MSSNAKSQWRYAVEDDVFAQMVCGTHLADPEEKAVALASALCSLAKATGFENVADLASQIIEEITDPESIEQRFLS